MKAALLACPRCLLALGDRCVRSSLARGDRRVCGDSEHLDETFTENSSSVFDQVVNVNAGGRDHVARAAR